MRAPPSRAGSPTGVARKVLLDTGFVVALVNAKDADHERCLAVWKTLRARIFSVEGVLVESAHLLGRVPGGASHASRLVFESGAQIAPFTAERAMRAASLMAKYHDVPMDFVDALLVTVAEDEDVREVLTLDRRGFLAYRALGRRPFHVLP